MSLKGCKEALCPTFKCHVLPLVSSEETANYIPAYWYYLYLNSKGKKGKPIPVRGHRDLQDCETSRLPHFLDNRPTDGGEVVSLTRQPAALYPQEDSWYSFLLEAESVPGP
jgi:hypothetical protein